MIELLLSLILALTGIGRTTDPYLVSVAEQRVQEIQFDFSHDGMQTAEILAWNQGFGTAEESVRRVVVAWQESPAHWAIMSDPGYDRIGCAMDVDETLTYWYVCAFGSAPAPAPVAPAPAAPPAQEPAPAPPSGEPPAMLPDTAMRPSG